MPAASGRTRNWQATSIASSLAARGEKLLQSGKEIEGEAETLAQFRDRAGPVPQPVSCRY